MKVFHIDASARTDGSHSRALSAQFVVALRARNPDIVVDRLDLAVDVPRHFGALETAAISIPAAEHTAPMKEAIADSDALVARVLAADAVVIGSPIYNFGMPSTLKSFFDHISRNGLTFIADETGTRGLLGEKKVAVFSAAGGSYGPGEMFDGLDNFTPHARAILGFMGVTDMTLISARPMMFAAPEVAETAMVAAKKHAEELARQWT